MHSCPVALAVSVLLFLGNGSSHASSAKAKQQVLAQWTELTSSNVSPPTLVVRGTDVRLRFEHEGKPVVFKATWRTDRAPTDKYRIGLGKLRPTRSRPPSAKDTRWEQALVLTGEEARSIGADLRERLTPAAAGHGLAYEALFADRALFRDAQGVSRVAYQKEKPDNIVLDHHFFPAESLEVLASHLDQILATKYPDKHLFVIMAPDATRFVQPLLIDRRRRQCVGLRLAALFDSAEPGLGFKVIADGFSALVLESHCLALIKNPLSSVARLVDACAQNVVRLVRVPGVNLRGQFIPAASPGSGMDLNKWEQWLDRHTGTRLEDGSLRILSDGDQFFGRLDQAIRDATNHIFGDVYLFDRDDVAIKVADLLKQRANEVPVKITYDRLCSLIGGQLPKITPIPEDFEPPFPIARYLKKNSKIEVRPFLNPWISVNHSKLFLVDGHRAWIGGMNLGREYMHEWHDFMIEIEGPVVDSLESQFQKEWAHAGPWGDFAYAAAVLKAPPPKPLSNSKTWSKVRRLPTSKGLRKPFKTAVLTSLDQARSYIYIENGYLFDHGVVVSLIQAHQRGVDVRVILPRVNNFTAGIRSNLAIAERLRRNGIRVYLWPGMTHAKAVLVDGWSCMGSANLNQWSLRLSEEENIATSDPAFAAEVKSKVFDADFARCYELTERIHLNATDHIVDKLLSY